MIQNVGFQFSKTAKQWMAAFIVASVQAGGAMASPDESKHHYELLSLSQIEAREAKARDSGDSHAFAEFSVAAAAIRDTVEGRRATPNDLPSDFETNLFSQDEHGNMYRVIDPARDIDWTEYFISQKTARVKAEKVEPGTVVETVMADGHVETTKTAGPDGGYRVTNPTGEQYLVDTAKFDSVYEVVGGGVFAPKPDPRKVVDLDENVSFTAPWGMPMFIKEGGVLVYGGKDDIYGIQPDEYNKTYSAVEPV